MAVYIILVFWIWMIYLIHGRRLTIRRNYLEDQYIHRRAKRDVFFIALFFAVLIAFRDVSVGIDTRQYEYNFSKVYVGLARESAFFSSREWGYKLIQIFIKKLGLGFQGVLIFEAFIYVVPVAYVIYKYSKNPYISFFLFLSMGYFLFGMTAIRQSIAMGMLMIAFEMAVRNKKLWFVLITLLASTVHTTALVFLPVIVLSKIPLRKRYVLLAIFAGVLMSIYKQPIQQFMVELAHNPYENMETGGNGMYLFLISVVILDLISGNKTNRYWDNASLITYMMISAVIVYPVLQFNPAVFRLHYYYSIMMVIYIPNVLKKYRNVWLRWGLTWGYFAIAIYYMFNYSFNIMGAVPYKFCF